MKTDKEILEERAILISGPNFAGNEEGKGDLALVEFMLIPEKYAVEESYVSEVLLLKELTPIPGIPDFVAGITYHRGRIVSVLNLKILFGIKTKGITELNRIIILNNNEMEFGILTDSILGTIKISEGMLAPAPLNLHANAGGFVKGITVDGSILLDCDRLLNDEKIRINQIQK